MPEYRIRYIVGRDTPIIGRPVYHSVTVQSEQPPDADQAIDAAFLQESNLYEKDDTYTGDEIEIDDIRELAPMPPVVGRMRARYVYDYDNREWIGPLFEGNARHF